MPPATRNPPGHADGTWVAALRRPCPWAALLAVQLLLSCAMPALAQQTQLRFERQWPALQQPWYYDRLNGFSSDADGNLLMVDGAWCRVHKLSPDGRVVSTFRGCPGEPYPHNIRGMDLDTSGRIYLADFFDGVTRYLPDGSHDPAWTLQPPVTEPTDIWLTPDGAVFVADRNGLQQYGSDGNLSRTWPVTFPFGVELDGNGNLLIGNNGQVETYTQDAQLLATFTASPLPSTLEALRIDRQGRIAVADNQARVKFFLPNGTLDEENLTLLLEFVLRRSFVTVEGIRFEPNNTIVLGTNASIMRADGNEILSIWSSDGRQPGFFQAALQLGKPAVDTDGLIYVADHGNIRIQVFDSQGQYLRSWDTSPHEPIALDIVPPGLPDAGTLYMVSLGNALLHYSNTGTLINQWSDASLGMDFQTGDVAVHPDGRFFVITNYFNVSQTDIYRFTAAGVFDSVIYTTSFRPITALTVNGAGNLLLAEKGIGLDGNTVVELDPDTGMVLDTIPVPAASRFTDIEVDSRDNVYLSDDVQSVIYRIDAVTDAVETFGEEGFDAGLFFVPHGLAINADDDLHVFDTNDRMQVFRTAQLADSARAIVVAGGGPYPGNSLWNATQLNANFAFRTLIAQGFSKQTIQYLSDDLTLDLDRNGLVDEIDAGASNANLMDAILGPFADGADELLIYLVDHGGFDTFRMSATEVLDAGPLANWLDTWQAATPGSRLTVIYDACQSGSFVDDLQSSLHDRVVIASSEATENAFFVSAGTLSFSNLFWTNIFNGQSLGNAYQAAATATEATFPSQVPQLDADGDGSVNTLADQSIVAGRFIGAGTSIGGSAPIISDATVDAPVGSAATIRALGVTDPDGLARVWAVIRGPDFDPGSPNDPVRELPSVDLLRTTGNDFAGIHTGFNTPGVYRITVHAQDSFGNTAVPEITTLSVADPLKRRAVIVVGGVAGDPGLAGFQTAGRLAAEALFQQGYGPSGDCTSAGCDDVLFLSNVGLPGSDASADRVNVEDAITDWGLFEDGLDTVADVQDLTVMLVGDLSSGALRLTASESLPAADLDGWLSTTRAQLPGTLTVIVEGDRSGAYAQQFALSGGPSIVIASTDVLGESLFIADGEIGFAKFFWGQVFNGATVRQAFSAATVALAFSSAQRPQLDDTGNAVFNEPLDGLYANRYTIGSGLLLAGDSPYIGRISSPAAIGPQGYPVHVEDVTTTGTISRVIAVYEIDGTRLSQDLAEGPSGRYQAQLALDPFGVDVAIAVFAIDDEGNASLPAQTVAIADGIFLNGFEGD